MNLTTWNHLTLAEIEHLERTYDGPITEQAVRDLIAQRAARTRDNLIHRCKAQAAVIADLQNDIEHFRRNGKTGLIAVWEQKLDAARGTLDRLDDELANMGDA